MGIVMQQHGSSWVKSCWAYCFTGPLTARSGVYSAVVNPFLTQPYFTLPPLPVNSSHPLPPSFSMLPPRPSPHSTSYSSSKLPLALSSVCVLDSAFLDGGVCNCRETLRALAGPSVSRCFFGVWQLSASVWLSLLLLTALLSVFLHYCTHLKNLL